MSFAFGFSGAAGIVVSCSCVRPAGRQANPAQASKPTATEDQRQEIVDISVILARGGLLQMLPNVYQPLPYQIRPQSVRTAIQAIAVGEKGRVQLPAHRPDRLF